jgi:hypothetical protein
MNWSDVYFIYKAFIFPACHVDGRSVGWGSRVLKALISQYLQVIVICPMSVQSGV